MTTDQNTTDSLLFAPGTISLDYASNEGKTIAWKCTKGIMFGKITLQGVRRWDGVFVSLSPDQDPREATDSEKLALAKGGPWEIPAPVERAPFFSLFRVYSGDLFKASAGGFRHPVRPAKAYSYQHREIKSGRDLRACLRAGEYAWPGGYRCFFITSDGGTLSFDAVKENFAGVIDSIRTNCGDGWQVVALECASNCDGPVYCDHSNETLVDSPED